MGDERIQFMTQIERYLDSLLPSLASRQKPLYSTAAPQGYLQSQIDSGMLRLDQSLCRLLVIIRRERNLFSPVSALPPEILANIFSYGSFTDTLCVSWVSSTWRAAATNAPSLWTHFDWYRYPNDDFRDLQLARCRMLALELNLDRYQSLTGHLQGNPPPPNMLSRAHSITHLMNLSCLENIDLSKLESLHARYRSLYHLPSLRLETTALRYLFLDMPQWELPQDLLHMGHLQTLHLRIEFQSPSGSGPILDHIAGLPQLQELSVRFGYSDSSIDSQEELDLDLNERPILKRIYLLNTPSSFQQGFLRRFKLAEHTNIEISPFRPSSDCLLRSQVGTNTLWIDQVSGVLLYDHGASVTKIATPPENAPSYFNIPDLRFHGFPDSGFRGFPDSISLDNITSLIINGGAPPTAKDLQSLVHLTSLSFLFYPISPPGRAGLSDTLNKQLVKSCPRLHELVMVRGRSVMAEEERAVETVLSFLKTWESEYQVVFGILRISTHISPRPWLEHRNMLISFTKLFKLQRVDLGHQAPSFPEPTQFVPEPPWHTQG